MSLIFMNKKKLIQLYIDSKNQLYQNSLISLNTIANLAYVVLFFPSFIFCLCIGWSSFYNWRGYRVCEGIGATSSMFGVTKEEEATWRSSSKTSWGSLSCGTTTTTASILSNFAYSKRADEACGDGDWPPRRNRRVQVLFGRCWSEASRIWCHDQNPIKEEARTVDQDHCCTWRSTTYHPSHQHHHHWTNSSLFIQCQGIYIWFPTNYPHKPLSMIIIITIVLSLYWTWFKPKCDLCLDFGVLINITL